MSTQQKPNRRLHRCIRLSRKIASRPISFRPRVNCQVRFSLAMSARQTYPRGPTRSHQTRRTLVCSRRARNLTLLLRAKVRMLSPDLACVGLSDDLGIDHWGLKLSSSLPSLISSHLHTPRALKHAPTVPYSRRGSCQRHLTCRQLLQAH